MSEAEVDVVRRAAEAYTNRGAEAVLDFLDPDVEWRARPDLPDAGIYHGAGKIARVDEFATKQEALAAAGIPG
jgi:ketosteroid isomerase-like protein